MSRTRLELTIRVTTVSPLHSGGIDEAVDRAIRGKNRTYTPRRFVRDGSDRPVLTGRSFKGAVRAACDDTTDSVDDLWGGIDRAASLTFHAIEIPESRIAQRPGIAVDRYWGTAADTALFSHEVLPAGTPLTLRITGEARDDQHLDEVQHLLRLILALFKAGKIILGGRKNAGWGRVVLDQREEDSDHSPWDYSEYALDSPDALNRWLSDKPTTPTLVPLEGDFGSPVRITIDWESPTGILVAEASDEDGEESQNSRSDAASDDFRPVPSPSETISAHSVPPAPPSTTSSTPPKPGPHPVGPVHVKAQNGKDTRPEDDRKKPTPTRGHKDIPQGRRIDEDTYDTLPLVLPGSSIRGALRSRASRIARTVLAHRAAKGNAPAQQAWSKVSDWSDTGVHRQLAADPALVRDLFGSTEQRGAVSVLDSVTTSLGAPRSVTHNAGDRWTGGAADGALFSETIHAEAQWSSIVLEFDPERVETADMHRQRAAWCLLGLVLAELATGSLSLGSRSTRGLGHVRVRGIRIEGGPQGFFDHSPLTFLPEEDTQHDEGVSEPGIQIARELLEHLRSISIDANRSAGPGWEGWSSYLIDSSSSSERNEP